MKPISMNGTRKWEFRKESRCFPDRNDVTRQMFPRNVISEEPPMKRLGIGQSLLLGSLIAMLAMALGWAAYVWNESSGTPMDKHGWIALGLGTLFSLLIGCGLMALMFFSSRSGHDEQADPFRRREHNDSRPD
jgi:hypothetical protein